MVGKADAPMQDHLMEAFLLSVQPLSRISGPPPEPVMNQNQPSPIPSSAPGRPSHNDGCLREGTPRAQRLLLTMPFNRRRLPTA